MEDELTERDDRFDAFPPISPGLLAALDISLPERWPNVEMPDRDIWVRAGQLKVIEFLRHVYRTQQANSQLEGNHV